MSTRRSVLHDVTRQMGALLPDLRVTRSRTLAWFMLGLLWAGTVSLTAVAAHLPGSARTASTEQRLRRWLTNPAVVVETMWGGLLPVFFAVCHRMVPFFSQGAIPGYVPWQPTWVLVAVVGLAYLRLLLGTAGALAALPVVVRTNQGIATMDIRVPVVETTSASR